MDGQKPQRGGKEANQESKDDKGMLPAPLPPPCISSPSHEFSFTISLHPSFMPSPKPIKCNETTPSIAVDMAPADDVFFQGHLLPFHFASQSPISPRPSDICIENLSLPLENFRSDGNLKYHNHYSHNTLDTGETKERTNSKSFSSLFGLGKWRKASDIAEKDENKKKKKKKGFDMNRFLKKYARMVEPFLFFKRESSKRDLHHQPYSFSGRPNPKEKVGWRRRRGEFSAPASMRTSPTNSGLLLASSMPFNSSDESTMEELQSAIQAAIAHCKNSTATMEEKCK